VNDYHAPDSTSGGGSMLRLSREPILVGLMLFGIGTSSAQALPPEVASGARTTQQTTSGARVTQPQRSGKAISEFRRLSGLTWDQLAGLFGVSRRSVHFWASGKAMTSANEAHLQRLLAALKRIDRGSAGANRAALLAVHEDGGTLLGLLARGQYDLAVNMIVPGYVELQRPALFPLDDEVKAVRAPRKPEELVGAPGDPVDRGPAISRAARSVRARGGR
jgi:transcriptional regulator with XRE-family HTH domain